MTKLQNEKLLEILYLIYNNIWQIELPLSKGFHEKLHDTYDKIRDMRELGIYG